MTPLIKSAQVRTALPGTIVEIAQRLGVKKSQVYRRLKRMNCVEKCIHITGWVSPASGHGRRTAIYTDGPGVDLVDTYKPLPIDERIARATVVRKARYVEKKEARDTPPAPCNMHDPFGLTKRARMLPPTAAEMGDYMTGMYSGHDCRAFRIGEKA